VGSIARMLGDRTALHYFVEVQCVPTLNVHCM
jgi:hypothetical protein